MDGGDSIEFSTGGTLRSSSGVSYRRTPDRIKRSNGGELIDSGAPVVTDVYPEGMVIYEGAAASAAWKQIAPRLVLGKRPRVRDLQWVGHIWLSEQGHPLLYFAGKH